MYFLEQLQRQFMNNIVSYNHPTEGPWNSVDTTSWVEKTQDTPMTPEWARELAEDAGRTSGRMKVKSTDLEAGAAELIGGEWDDTTRWDDWGDVLGWAAEAQVSPEWVTEVATQTPEEERASVIAELEAGGQFPEWMDEEAREELIQARLEANDTEKPMTEEEIQALDAKHQEILEYARGLGLEWLDAEEIKNVFWDMTPEQITEFEAMTPEEQTEFMLWKSETLMEANKQILAEREAELEAEREAWVSPERERAIAWEQRQIQSARNAISWNWPGNTWFFRWGSENAMMPWGEAGTLTPEQLAEFWPMWWELAAYALTCEPATGEKSYCGKNTWEMLNSYYRSIWKPELQINDRPRHGYIWASLLAGRPDQFKEISVTPQNAPVWCLISYAAGPGWSSAFAQYGHIETKCSENQYHFWQVASSPGGSKRPPQEWEYRVFMPTSKTA